MHRCFLLAGLLWLQPRAHAWWDEGHMAIAQIAENHLLPVTREKMVALVPLGADERNNRFVTAACWADDLKADGVRFYDDWHFLDTPLGPGATKGKPEGRLLWAMNRCVAVLKPRSGRDGKPLPPAPAVERARALRFLLHLVGDAHQPLHCASWFGLETPHGDRGGNDYMLGGDARNLHALWDSAGGLFTGRPERGDLAPIRERAAQIEKAFPPKAVKEHANSSFLLWTQESAAVARDFAYITPRDGRPSAEYIHKTQQAAMRRMALAGYRLAALLNRIFAPETQKAI